MGELIDLLSAGPATAQDEAGVVWHLGPTRFFERRKIRTRRRRLWDAVLAGIWEPALPVYLLPPDEHPDQEILCHLRAHPSGAWEVIGGPGPIEALRAELAEGNWLLYAAPQPLDAPFPDPFRSAAADLVEFMGLHDVKRFIASFYDDAEWLIGVS